MSQENVEVARIALAAYNRRDFDTMRALNDPEVELDWSRSRGLEAGVYRGSDAVMRFYENFLGTFEEIVVEADRFVDVGDCVVVPNHTRFTGRDGIKTEVRSTFVFESRRGLIVRICLYQDPGEAFEAAGLQE
jgi:ketosteroid isomerase-like protein